MTNKQDICNELERMYNVLDIIGMRKDVSVKVHNKIWKVQLRLIKMRTTVKFCE